MIQSNVVKSRASSLRALPASYTPTDQDVICAKGKDAKKHLGNKYLRALIVANLEEYRNSASRAERSYVVSHILKEIENRGGLFVRKVKGGWADIQERNAREKVGATFRDFLHEYYRSSTKAKAMIRRHKRLEFSAQSSQSDSSEEQFSLSTNGSSNTLCSDQSVQSQSSPRYFPDAPASSMDDFEPLPVTQSLVHLDFDLESARNLFVEPHPQQPPSFEDAMREFYSLSSNHFYMKV